VRGVKLKIDLFDALGLLLEKLKYGISAVDNVFGMFRVHKTSSPALGCVDEAKSTVTASVREPLPKAGKHLVWKSRNLIKFIKNHFF
jgi:hypothetical protein